jgi:putative FmdB family regulatory protein
MPLYEYQCAKCRARVEVVQKSTDARLKKCEKCGGLLKKLVSAPAIQFKGNGWYVTDYAKKSAGEKEDKPKSKARKSETAPASQPAAPDTSSSKKED